MVEFLPIDCNNDRTNERKKSTQTTRGLLWFVVVFFCYLFFFSFRLFRSFIAFAWFKEKIMHSSIKGLTKLIKDEVKRRKKK